VPSSTLRYGKDLLTKVHEVYFALEEPLESNRLEFEEENVDLDLLLKKIAAEYHAVGRKWTLGEKMENRAENNNYDLSKKTERQPKNEPIGIKLTEVKEAPNIGCGPLNEIENKASEWNLKSAEGLEKVFKTWSKKRDEF
ncbi:25028_t:CDS:2, partial [Gigaspora rosea]